MIKLVSLLSKVLGMVLALLTAFGAGWVSCTMWVIMGLHKDSTPNYSKPRYRSYRERDEEEERAV